MLRTVILAACFCALACLSSVAEARPRGHHFVDATNMVGCADPVMRPCEEISRNLKASRFQKIPSRVKYVAERSRPSAWCGWQMRQWMGVRNPAGNLARWWAGYGSRAHSPAVGVIVVWRHHVGIITGKTERGWVVKSGNDGNAVRERVRSVAGAIAFRWP
ncbi:hypothetical protein ACWX0K_20260 [Nitrobacteraceae bacterium UC4446_H13]